MLHLRGYGLVKVFRIVIPDGDTEHWATDELEMDAGTRRRTPSGFAIENYHRELKQNCGVAHCQARSSRAQRNHIGLAIAGVLATGVALLHHRGERVRGQTAADPARGPGLPPPAIYNAAETVNRVTPTAI